jgi:8-oxo-dGTP pyrophosphatase MutT (NUDIX family)
MHRQPLLELLDAYQKRHPEESACVEKIRALTRAHEDCFLRDCQPGHITASSWIVSHDLERVLLTHHRKLGLWLQLGGHADGDPNALEVALREAREESGMQRFRVVESDATGLPFDLDVHRIPAHEHEPAHEHHDLRFLLVAEPGQSLIMSHESNDLRWFSAAELPAILHEESLLRMQRKARALLEPGSGGSGSQNPAMSHGDRWGV